jgi:phenylalanyl-tRNA synthetase beta chain
MRPTLLPGLISSLRHNLNHGIRDVRLFEIGRIFAIFEAGGLPEERLSLGMLCTGARLEADRAQADRDVDFFDLKGALETGVEWMNLAPVRFAQAQIKHLRPGQSAAILLNDGRSIGSLGRLSETVAAAHKFRQPVFVLELDLSSLLATDERLVQYTPLPRYPSVVRDVSLLLDRDVTLNEIVSAVNAQAVAECRAVRFVGTYEGTNIPEGKRSITVRIEYRSDERTLRDEEVEQRHKQLTSSLLETFHAEQR